MYVDGFLSKQLIKRLAEMNINDEEVLPLLKEAEDIDPFTENATSTVIKFLKSQSGLIRYNTLRLLVLIWGQYQIEVICKEIANDDADDDVRSMAIACIGVINSNIQKQPTIKWLVSLLNSKTEEIFLKHSTYRALLNIIGVPSGKWPRLSYDQKEFENQVDWVLIKLLE